jgi:nanoRNase/pAp phosphatase (c-di-AMP/oligoRNAs hydrolase)
MCRGIGALCYEEAGMENADKNYKVSLRSVEEEDTTVVSKHFGGGGHKNASSFMIAKEQWTEWKNIA